MFHCRAARIFPAKSELYIFPSVDLNRDQKERESVFEYKLLTFLPCFPSIDLV